MRPPSILYIDLAQYKGWLRTNFPMLTENEVLSYLHYQVERFLWGVREPMREIAHLAKDDPILLDKLEGMDEVIHEDIRRQLYEHLHCPTVYRYEYAWLNGVIMEVREVPVGGTLRSDVKDEIAKKVGAALDNWDYVPESVRRFAGFE